METLLSIAIALMAGLLLSRLMKPLKLPAVTGYLIAGILIGPYCLGRLGVPGLGFVSTESVQDLGILSEVALGFIAFAIGNEFRLSQLRSTGRQATVIGILQAVAATLCVLAALFLLQAAMGGTKLSTPVVLTLGAIAAATAPAATLMVVKQYKAKGKLTDILLPVVALDDAVGLIIFAVCFGAAKAMTSGSLDFADIIVEPILEVVLSLALGTLMGCLLTVMERYFKSNSKRLSLTITFVLMTVSFSMLEFQVGGVRVGFSSLLTCMMLGTMFCNLCDFSPELMEKSDKWTAPLYVLFFVISGAELQFDFFTDLAVVLIGVVFILARCVGKYFGAFGSAKLMRCDDTIVKYLGITLFPQAGVALGMSMKAEALGADGMLIRNIVLFAVLVYELAGPYFTKVALTRAGDITPKAVPQAEQEGTGRTIKKTF